ncbi:hypothetical protein CGK63_07495, partial [Vibrio parahaemolyticus]
MFSDQSVERTSTSLQQIVNIPIEARFSGQNWLIMRTIGQKSPSQPKTTKWRVLYVFTYINSNLGTGRGEV